MASYTEAERTAERLTEDFERLFLDSILQAVETREGKFAVAYYLRELYLSRPGDVLDCVQKIRGVSEKYIHRYSRTDSLSIPPIEELIAQRSVWKKAQARERRLNSERQKKIWAEKKMKMKS